MVILLRETRYHYCGIPDQVGGRIASESVAAFNRIMQMVEAAASITATKAIERPTYAEAYASVA